MSAEERQEKEEALAKAKEAEEQAKAAYDAVKKATSMMVRREVHPEGIPLRPRKPHRGRIAYTQHE